MTVEYNDQTDWGDGVTVSDTNLPNVIGWGETSAEAMLDMLAQTNAIVSAVADCLDILDEMGHT